MGGKTKLTAGLRACKAQVPSEAGTSEGGIKMTYQQYRERLNELYSWLEIAAMRGNTRRAKLIAGVIAVTVSENPDFV